jgi:hypothetical protein
MIDKTTPRWNKAILLSASHFMSGVPAGMTGMELIDTLLDEETPLPEDMLLWESLDADRLDLVEHISSLAEDFYNFPL